MKVSDYYASSCATKKALQLHTEGASESEYRATRKLLDAVCEGIPFETALSDFRSDLEKGLKPDFFPFEWQKAQRIEDDMKCIERFFGYLGDRHFISSNKVVSAENFEVTVGLLTERGGNYDAYVIKWYKADKSPAGKSVHTNTSTDLYALVAKAGLEEVYPNVKVNLVYLRNDNDTAGFVTSFIVAKSKKSNIFTLSFENFYDESGVFDRDALVGEIKRVSSETPPKDCYNCRFKDTCAANTVQDTHPTAERQDEGKTGWKMPEKFTPAQNKVINLVNGPAVVCAGPGSGKTATLVGRMRHLIENEGVEPEFILAITFTKDAAGELLARCKSFCDEDSMPQIMTLNAFGYMLITKNPDYLGKKVKLLGVTDRKKLLKTLYEAKGPLKGFSDLSLYGRTGLLETLDRKMSAFSESPEEFMQKNPQYGDDFKAFVETFRKAVEEHGYITYDEQITMASKLLDENPQVLEAMTARYKYIMVDEFQDIDQAQWELISRLSGSHNLVVVGDDDQSIYGFRGGSNRYMLDFKRVFPEAKQIVLTENFRSTENLVNEASGFISRNKRRIGKDIRSVRGKGMAPVIRQGKGAQDVRKAVAELQSSGIKLADIAILATKNATLEELYREVDFPAVLGKSFLVDSPAFKCLYGALMISKSYDEGIMVSTLLTMGVSLDALPAKGLERLVTEGKLGKGSALYKPLHMFRGWLDLISSHCSIAKLLDRVFADIGYGESADSKAVYDVLESRKDVRDLDSLRELMSDMVNFSSDTRIEPGAEEAVLLITSHESKGMEWRAVILVDDFSTDGSEETNRLYYVAMTRAKDALYILTDGDTLLKKAI